MIVSADNSCKRLISFTKQVYIWIKQSCSEFRRFTMNEHFEAIRIYCVCLSK